MLFFASILTTTQVLAEAPATLRVDFYHSGNHATEMFSLDRVVLEPLPWTGNMQRPIDKTLRGKYLFEIVDPDSGAIAWSRSFSSIYGEWETTREAKQLNRTFHESVRFPAQNDEFELVLKKRNAQNDFEEIWDSFSRLGLESEFQVDATISLLTIHRAAARAATERGASARPEERPQHDGLGLENLPAARLSGEGDFELLSLLGEGGIAILQKVFGIILLAIAVKLFSANAAQLFHAHG